MELAARNLYVQTFKITEDHGHRLWRIHLQDMAKFSRYDFDKYRYSPTHYTAAECAQWAKHSPLNIDCELPLPGIRIALDIYHVPFDYRKKFNRQAINSYYFYHEYLQSYYTYTRSMDILDLAIQPSKIEQATYTYW